MYCRVGIGGPEKLKEVHVEVVDATAEELHKVRRRTSGATAPQQKQKLDSPNNTSKQLEKERQVSVLSLLGACVLNMISLGNSPADGL